MNLHDIDTGDEGLARQAQINLNNLENRYWTYQVRTAPNGKFEYRYAPVNNPLWGDWYDIARTNIINWANNKF